MIDWCWDVVVIASVYLYWCWCLWWSSTTYDLIFNTNMLMMLLIVLVFTYYWCRWWCFSIHILKLQMMAVQYSLTEDKVCDTYDVDDDVLNIHILKMQMMMLQYSHTEDANDDGLVFTYWRCWWWWFSIHILKMQMKMI